MRGDCFVVDIDGDLYGPWPTRDEARAWLDGEMRARAGQGVIYESSIREIKEPR